MFSLSFQRRAWLAAQADATEASARELISKFPEEIPEEEREARKEGNSLIFFVLNLPFTFQPMFKPILMMQISFSELMEDIDLDTFLKEDQVALAKRGRESMARVVRELCDYLQCECGEEEALPDNVFCDVMLQVHTCIYIYLL